MSTDTFLYKILFLVVIILTAANLTLLSLHLSNTAATGTGPVSSSSVLSGGEDKVFSGLAAGLHAIGQAGKTSGRVIARSATQSINFVSRAATATTSFAIHGTVGSVAIMAQAASQVVTAVPKAAVDSPLVQPADKMKLPVIDSAPQALPASTTVAAAPAPQPPPAPAQWPLHGRITTAFGANDLPYERYHTGIDISDGKSSPIRPFRPGRVIQAVSSYYGLGNHVVLDNGGGITSVYGHLRSITVAVGQQVDESSVLGYEGSTGASTGTHLHFEIKVHGVPTDPRKFIAGLP
jgi:murein DD-endopeptidase MepM/ murein hydrolase activator NlpD